MEVSNVWASLLHWGPMDPLGQIISWLPFLIGELVVLPPIQTGEANLVDPMTVLPSHGVVLSVPCRITSAGFRKTRAALRAVSVTIYSKRIVRSACKVPPLPEEYSVIVWSIGGIATGISRLINNLCGEFPLVVSGPVTFLFFPSLVWVANFGSLLGSIYVSSSSEW